MMQEEYLTKEISIRVKPTLHEALLQSSRKENVTLSSLIRNLVRDAVKKKDDSVMVDGVS